MSLRHGFVLRHDFVKKVMENTAMSTTTRPQHFSVVQAHCAWLMVLAILLVTPALAQRTDNNYSRLPNYSESFETLTGWGSSTPLAVSTTNGWYSTPDDFSVITNLSYSFTNCTYPLSSATSNNVLRVKLNNLAILTNNFDATPGSPATGYNMQNVPLYIDMMVQFMTNSQGAFVTCTTNDTGVKGAVYVDSASSNLVVYHGTMDAGGNYLAGQNTNEILSALVTPTNWYRLTIAYSATSQTQMFKVLTNGVAVQSSHAYADGWQTSWPPTTSPAGIWFRSAAGPALYATNLNAVAFQGSGYVDDLVVANTPPTYQSGGSTFLLIVANNGNGKTDFTKSNNTDPLTQITVASASSTTIVYTANGWYQISALTSNGVTVAAAAGATIYTQTLTGISLDISNNVTFITNYTGAVVDSVPSSWALTMGLTVAYATAHPTLVQEGYMLNLNPATLSPTLGIASLDMTGSTLNVTVLLQNNGAPADVKINGTLRVYASDAPNGTYTEVGAAALLNAQFDVNGKCVLAFTVPAANFYRAQVTYP